MLMKSIFLCLFFLGAVLSDIELSAQEFWLKDSIGSDYYERVLLMEGDQIKDTLCVYYYQVEILDVMLVDSATICYIVKGSEIIVQYQKSIFVDGKWMLSPTTGILCTLPGYMGALPRWWEDYQPPHSFEILSEDLVRYYRGDEEIIKDCKDFERDREERVREYQEYLKKQKKE